METLDDLIARYEQQYSIQPLRFCENDTVNSILFYYFNRTKNSEVDFDVICNIPEEIFIDRIELSVLFGNLLENAIEATIKKETGRFIRVRSSFSGECLSLIISNSYEIMPEQHGEVFRSKKHSGNGIGIESVKNISLHYHGTSSFTFQDGVFTASVLLYPDTTDSKTGR
jgi:sensor histidine kinase regulating citrate/malate metabolism